MLDNTPVFLYEIMTVFIVSLNYVFFTYRINEEEKRYQLLEQKYKDLEKRLLHYELMEYHKKNN